MSHLDTLTIGRHVTVHTDDLGPVPATIVAVTVHHDPVRGFIDRAAVAVRTDAGDEWVGIDPADVEAR